MPTVSLASSRELAIGVVAFLVAVISNLLGWAIIDTEDDDPDWSGFLVASLICLVLASLLFLVLIPRLKAEAGSVNKPALWGLGLSLISIPLIILWWLGVPFITASAGFALGLIGLERAREQGRRWPAIRSRSHRL